MQEIREDGSQKLTGRATLGEFQDAIARSENRSVALHKPGSIITQPSGDQYIVDESGAWRRIKDVKGREALELLMAAHKREKDELCAQIAHWQERAHVAEAALAEGK